MRTPERAARMSVGFGLVALAFLLFSVLAIGLPIPGPVRDAPTWQGGLRFAAPLILMLLGGMAIALGREASRGDQAPDRERSPGAARTARHEDGSSAYDTATVGLFLGWSMVIAGVLGFLLLFVYLSGVFLMP